MVPLRKSHDHEAKCWLILGHPSNLQIPSSYDPISSPQPGLRLELLVELPFGRAGEDHAQLSRAERQVAEHRQVTSHHHTCAVEASENRRESKRPMDEAAEEQGLSVCTDSDVFRAFRGAKGCCTNPGRPVWPRTSFGTSSSPWSWALGQAGMAHGASSSTILYMEDGGCG